MVVAQLDLKDGPDGATLKVKVKPKGSRDAVLGVRAKALLISVTAPPEKGKANRAAIAVLAAALGTPKSAIEVVTGETYAEKVLRIRGLTAAQIRDRLTLEPA